MPTTDTSPPLDTTVPFTPAAATSPTMPDRSGACAERPVTAAGGAAVLTPVDLADPVWTIHHLARALHLSVDRAREYSYSPSFPAPRAGFGRNLWLRAHVLEWFERLPAGERRAGNGATARRPAQPRRTTYTPRSPR